MKKPNLKYDLPSYSEKFLESLNPRMQALRSSLGYSDYSPFRNEPFIDIKTPTGMIDMSNTGIPLFANGTLLPPYSGLHNMGTTNVREIPARNIENFTVKFPLKKHLDKKFRLSGNVNPSINFNSPYLLDLYGRLRGEYNLNKNVNIFGEATTSTTDGVSINPATIKGGFNINFQKGGSPFQAAERQGVRNNPDGSHSTHLMRTETIDGINWISFPTLFENSDGTWLDLSQEENWKIPMMEARKRGEVVHFGQDKEAALRFGEGSWKPEEQSTMERGKTLPMAQDGVEGGTYGPAGEGDVITLDEGSNNPGMDFMRKWTNSPMHYQMLSKEDPDNVNFLTNARLSNLENVNTYYHSVPDANNPTRGGFSYTYYPEVHIFPGMTGTRTEEHEYSHQSDKPIDLDTAYSNFGVSDWFNYALNNDPLTLGANTLYKFYTGDDKGFIPGDPSKYATDDRRLIPQSSLDLTEELRFNENLEGNWYDSRAKEYEEEAKGYEEGSEEYESAMKKAESSSEWAGYVTNPTEVRARLNVIRSGASDLGIYDPFNEPINEEQFKNLLENEEKLIDGNEGYNPLDQLRDIYTDDEIFKMLNTISYNTDETPGAQSIGSDEMMARYGGSLPEVQKGNGEGWVDREYKIGNYHQIRNQEIEDILTGIPGAKDAWMDMSLEERNNLLNTINRTDLDVKQILANIPVGEDGKKDFGFWDGVDIAKNIETSHLKPLRKALDMNKREFNTAVKDSVVNFIQNKNPKIDPDTISSEANFYHGLSIPIIPFIDFQKGGEQGKELPKAQEGPGTDNERLDAHSVHPVSSQSNWKDLLSYNINPLNWPNIFKLSTHLIPF